VLLQKRHIVYYCSIFPDAGDPSPGFRTATNLPLKSSSAYSKKIGVWIRQPTIRISNPEDPGQRLGRVTANGTEHQ
jgi:hypothetical protein